tara:strand:- start:117 stop:716 length:600 start_codon:yes stop_codon:yes gene_type:complete
MLNLWGYTGALASVWIVLGVYIASLFYPNYSHGRQFCSELGTHGSPTQKLSPLINNYPLGLCFVLFGLCVAMQSSSDYSTLIIGAMVVAHGVGTWVAGYFPMDKDPYTTTPTRSCRIHSWAGLVMLLSLIVAPCVVIFDDNFSTNMRVFSAVCVLGCFYFSYRLVVSFKQRTNPGVHQRLSYGFQLLWLFVYSLSVASN